MGMGDFAGHGWYMVFWWLGAAALAVFGVWWLIRWTNRGPRR